MPLIDLSQARLGQTPVTAQTSLFQFLDVFQLVGCGILPLF